MGQYWIRLHVPRQGDSRSALVGPLGCDRRHGELWRASDRARQPRGSQARANARDRMLGQSVRHLLPTGGRTLTTKISGRLRENVGPDRDDYPYEVYGVLRGGTFSKFFCDRAKEYVEKYTPNYGYAICDLPVNIRSELYQIRMVVI